MQRPIIKIAGRSVTFFLLPLLVLVWTSVPAAAPYTLHLAVLAIVAGVAMIFIRRRSLTLLKTITVTLIVVLLVGGTGWFLSPFFFLLYLLPIYLGFLYSPAVALSFVAALLIIFAFSIGEVDLAFDIMTLLSLLLVIPLVMYLRQKYLLVQQSRKGILILEDDSGIKSADTIERLLANRITNLNVEIRQTLTFIKQAATLLLQDDELSPAEVVKTMQRIRTSAAETLEIMHKFESKTSANKALRSIAATNSSDDDQNE